MIYKAPKSPKESGRIKYQGAWKESRRIYVPSSSKLKSEAEL